MATATAELQAAGWAPRWWRDGVRTPLWWAAAILAPGLLLASTITAYDHGLPPALCALRATAFMAEVVVGLLFWMWRPRNIIGPLLVTYPVLFVVFEDLVPTGFRIRAPGRHPALLQRALVAVVRTDAVRVPDRQHLERVGARRLAVCLGDGAHVLPTVPAVRARGHPDGLRRHTGAVVLLRRPRLVGPRAVGAGLVDRRVHGLPPRLHRAHRPAGRCQSRCATPARTALRRVHRDGHLQGHLHPRPRAQRRAVSRGVVPVRLVRPDRALRGGGRVRSGADTAGALVGVGPGCRARWSRPGQVRAALARTLGDPSLVLGLWLPDRNMWADEDGREIDLPTDGSRAVTYVGDRLAVLVHDRDLLDQPRLLESVGAAARLALENERLQAQLRPTRGAARFTGADRESGRPRATAPRARPPRRRPATARRAGMGLQLRRPRRPVGQGAPRRKRARA